MTAVETRPTVEQVIDEATKQEHDDHEALEKIRAQEHVVADAETELKAATEARKLAQSVFDTAVERLRQIIREQSEVLPLFAKDDDAWRNESIGGLIYESRILNALGNANIESLGELHDFLDNGKKQITDIKGIGQAAADKLQAAIDEFWSKNGLPKTTPSVDDGNE